MILILEMTYTVAISFIRLLKAAGIVSSQYFHVPKCLEKGRIDGKN